LIFDEALPGFGVRVFASGKRSYFIKYKLPGGQQRKMNLGAALPGTLVETRKQARTLLARARIGEDVAGERHDKAMPVHESATKGELIQPETRAEPRHDILTVGSLIEKFLKCAGRRCPHATGRRCGVI
jgi:hypothetical protein